MVEESNNRIRSLKPIRVHSYSGYKAEERPISFILEGNELSIERIVDSWKQEWINPEEGRRVYFKIEAEGNQTFTIFYDEKNEEWFLLP
ncbi:MAG: hypothetical protein JSU92_13900 [Deltaproteobacteria bacterium]|nr:MAG: hypothetical protein JSU92_13900 [Deltaproteobacteria bacterium]